MEVVVGCDFGASMKAESQAKKTILIEAARTGEREYCVAAEGGNRRLVDGAARRRGWTIRELVESVANDSQVTVAAFDFPFSIPVALLRSEEFGAAVGAETFGSRRRWAQFVSARVGLESTGLRFDPVLTAWRHKRFWIRRSTDIATRAQPPLKHVFQNLFNMTMVGSKVVDLLDCGGRSVIETYPGAVARAIGFTGSYKKFPEDCLDRAEAYLEGQGIALKFDGDVRFFCRSYRTAGNDPDGADAFLCLVTALCFREGLAHRHGGAAAEDDLREEGAIFTPSSVAGWVDNNG